jgi:hypothetical protein
MTALWREHRAARFARRLDEAHRQAETAPPELDREFRAGLRAMLVAIAEREGIGGRAGDSVDLLDGLNRLLGSRGRG